MRDLSPAHSSADSDILDFDTSTTAPSSATTTGNDLGFGGTGDSAGLNSVYGQFPRTVGTTIISNLRPQKEDLSPAVSGFSFNLDPVPPPAASSSLRQYISLPEVVTYREPLVAPRKAPALARPVGEGSEGKMMADSLARTESTTRRVQYFQDAFANLGSTKETARERIQRDSPIIAELRTNVIIKDEYTIVTSLSQHLSERYRRPESAVLLTVTHSSCLMMGGSFEPAYVLDITAIPSEVQPVTNKRNAYLVQCFVADVLHVPSNRGVVRFNALEEEKIATNGSTIAGDIERAERDATTSKEDKPVGGLVHSLTAKSSRRSLMGGGAISVAGPPATERRKSFFRASDKEGNTTNGESNHNHNVERKVSTRSLRSMRSFRDRISSPPVPPPPNELPADSLPSPTSLHEFSAILKSQPSLPKIHRLSPLHGMNGLQFSTSSPNLSHSQTAHITSTPSTLPTSTTATTNSAHNGGILKETSILRSTSPPTPLSLTHAPFSFSISSSSSNTGLALRPFAPTSAPTTPLPSPPPIPDNHNNKAGTSKDNPLITSSSSSRRPSMSNTYSHHQPRPQSSRKNLSNITGPADAIPSPPPIPADDVVSPEIAAALKGPGGKLGKRKSFVNLFTRKSTAAGSGGNGGGGGGGGGSGEGAVKAI